MSETPNNDKQDHLDDGHDHLTVRHADGKSDKVAIPDDPEKVVRIGRELDNDVVLTDPRASRYHGELRRNAEGEVEVKDLGSANGVLLGTSRIKADSWQTVSPGQVIQMGETRLTWEKAASTQSTLAMTPAQRQQAAERTVPSAAQPPLPQPKTEEQSNMPLMIGIAALVLILLGVGVATFFVLGGGSEGEPTGAVEAPENATGAADATAATRSDLSEQNTGSVPTPTATPSGPQLAIPVVRIDSAEVRPIILAALPSTDKALYLVQVRVQNVGNASFNISTSDFSLKTGTGQILKEAGGTTTQEGLRRLGAVDRFDDLNLTPGGSVAESLIFELLPEIYDLELVFESPDANPVVLGLGTVDAGKELALALGTPVAEETPVAAATETPTSEPTPTATRPAAIPAPQVVPRSALVGTIAYPVFNGDTYDLYLGRVDGGGSRFYRGGASQPAFNSDGSRIAFHSWSGDSRGLVAMDVDGGNGALVTNFVEDQLPTWSADGQDIIFLSRRSGGRQSELLRANASTELADAITIGEGEYPTVGSNGQLTFKGWGQTAFGLRVGSEALEELKSVTNVDNDTAPALSPDGSQVVFMSRREENWDIYVANVDGSGLLRLTDDASDDGLPTWSPDGNAIAFVSNRGGTWAIWVMTPDGAGKSQRITLEGSPDGQVGTDTFASRGWAEERISWTAADLVQ